jgi:hypothetical protein
MQVEYTARVTPRPQTAPAKAHSKAAMLRLERAPTEVIGVSKGKTSVSYQVRSPVPLLECALSSLSKRPAFSPSRPLAFPPLALLLSFPLARPSLLPH